MPVVKNIKSERFYQGIAKGMSIELAYEAAGYKAKGHSAKAAGSRKLRSKEGRDRVAELMAPAVKAVELSVERTLQEMMHLAFYDMTAVLNVKAGKITMRDPTSLPEDLRRAIVGIKPVQVGDQLHYECKFADKRQALESLMRHLQMFKDMVIVENVFRIVNEMDDDELDRRLTELERAFSEAATLDPASGEGSESIH